MLIQTKTPQETDEAMRADAAARAPQVPANNSASSFLVSHVNKCWADAKMHRQTLTNRLLDCHRRRRSVYSPEKLAEIKTMGGSEIYMGIVAAKCRSAKAWIADLYDSDRPFTVDHTTVPDLPPEIAQTLIQEAMQGAMEYNVPPDQVRALLMKHKDRLIDEANQEAEKRATRMSDRIADAFEENDFRKEFRDFIDDLVTYPFACMKSLEYTRKKTLVWAASQEDGKFKPTKGSKIIAKARRVSPFRAYPSPSAGSSIDGHWVIEHQTFTRTDLANMRKSPGYDPEAIANVLTDFGVSGLKQWIWSEQEVERLKGIGASWLSSSDEIDGLAWSGTMSGKVLIENGVDDPAIDDPFEEYQITLLVIGQYLVQALVSLDPAGRHDYDFANWESVPGSIIGVALPERLAHCADMCNSAARALSDNMALSSGPMVGVFKDELAPGTTVKSLHPRKIFYFESRQAGSSFPIHFFQPQSNSRELTDVYEKYDRYADDISGLPSYAFGSDNAAGAGKTASGLSMLLDAVGKNIKDIVRDIDFVIGSVVEKMYDFLMLTDPDESIKGDAVVKARGSEELMHKAQAQLRQQELLSITNNPVDLSIIGMKGRATQLREVYKNSSLPEDRIIPTDDELLQREQAQQQAAQQQAPNVPPQ